jgi:hypothetical protein
VRHPSSKRCSDELAAVPSWRQKMKCTRENARDMSPLAMMVVCREREREREKERETDENQECIEQRHH